MIEDRAENGGPEPGSRVRAGGLLLAGAIVVIASCSAVPGRFTQWQMAPFEMRGDPGAVEVYSLEYDSVADHLELNERLAPHDTIGIIVHEPKLIADFEKREDFWKYDERVVNSLRERAWEMGGDVILLGTPELGRRGLRKMLQQFVMHESEAEGTRELEKIRALTRNPWVAHVAYVLRTTS